MSENQDYFLIAQQVQGLASAYMGARTKIAELEAELTTRREDIRRLEKQVAALSATKQAVA